MTQAPHTSNTSGRLSGKFLSGNGDILSYAARQLASPNCASRQKTFMIRVGAAKSLGARVPGNNQLKERVPYGE